LFLPIGGSPNHPLANPFGPSSPNLAGVALDSLDPILVVVGGDEILRDRVEDYARRLKVLLRKKIEFAGEQHAWFLHGTSIFTSYQSLHR
jgi:acetyl esterase/lipase